MKQLNFLLTLCALSAVLPLTSSALNSPAPQAPVAGPALAGTWDITGIPDPSSGVNPFTNVLTCGLDGMLVNLDPQVGAAAGGWSRSGPSTYDISFLGYLDVGFPATYEVSSTVQLDTQDGFSGAFLTTVRDLNGNYLFDYGGTVSGSRHLLQGL